MNLVGILLSLILGLAPFFNSYIFFWQPGQGNAICGKRPQEIIIRCNKQGSNDAWQEMSAEEAVVLLMKTP